MLTVPGDLRLLTSRLDVIAARLPFAVDDYAEAGRAFARWRASGSRADRETVEIWAYCYTYGYFHLRFARERSGRSSDMDAAMDRAYSRILENLDTVREPLKFASFVSVVCKRTLLNHRARRRETVHLEEHTLPTVPPPSAADYDRQIVREELAAAISRLPHAIRDIARMRLLDKVDYQVIAEQVGRPLPTVRTYVSKALARLRSEPGLLMLYRNDPLPTLDREEPDE